MDTQALWLTLRLAGLTTVLLLVLATPLALWLGSSTGVLRSCIQALVTVPLVLPPTVLGFYMLVALGPQTLFGRSLVRVLGHPLAFTFEGLLAGSMVYSLPFAVQPILAARRIVPRGLLDAAAGLGASPLRIVWEVVLPEIRSSILAAAVLSFAHTMGEFGVVLMLGGNIPGSTRTLSVSLYDLVEEGRLTEANRTALVLLAVALISLLALGLVPLWRERAGSSAA